MTTATQVTTADNGEQPHTALNAGDITAAPETTPPTAQDPNAPVVTLDEPIQRGALTITELTIRKPNAGALRGVTLMALATIEVTALQKVLPRICHPILTPQEIANLDPADLMSVGATVASFFMTKAERAAFQTS